MSTSPRVRAWKPLAAHTAIPLLEPEVRPRWLREVQVTERGEGCELHLRWKDVLLEGERGRRAARLLSEADGRRTLRELAAALGWGLEETRELGRELYHLAALEDAGEAPIAALSCHHHLLHLGRRVAARLSWNTGLHERLLAAPSRRLLRGILLEAFHATSLAAAHISVAVAHAPSQRLRMMFSEYLAEEYWHGEWLRQGLHAAGLTDEELARADPLPEGSATMNALRLTAGTDVLAYSVCLGVVENEGEAAARGLREGWREIASLGLLPEEALAPFREHALVDCEAGHESFAAEAFAEAPPLPQARREELRRTLLTYVHLLAGFHQAILRFYGAPEGPATFTL